MHERKLPLRPRPCWISPLYRSRDRVDRVANAYDHTPEKSRMIVTRIWHRTPLHGTADMTGFWPPRHRRCLPQNGRDSWSKPSDLLHCRSPKQCTGLCGTQDFRTWHCVVDTYKAHKDPWLNRLECKARFNTTISLQSTRLIEQGPCRLMCTRVARACPTGEEFKAVLQSYMTEYVPLEDATTICRNSFNGVSRAELTATRITDGALRFIEPFGYA